MSIPPKSKREALDRRKAQQNRQCQCHGELEETEKDGSSNLGDRLGFCAGVQIKKPSCLNRWSRINIKIKGEKFEDVRTTAGSGERKVMSRIGISAVSHG